MASVGPNSPGTMASVVYGTSVWADPDNAKVSDGLYAATTSASFIIVKSHYLEATNFGFAISTGNAIDGILVEIQRKSAFDTTKYSVDETVSLIKGGVVTGSNYASAVHWSTTENYFSYGGIADKWGTTWTIAEVNDGAFGIALAVNTFNGDEYPPPIYARVNHIRITVYYSADAPEPPEPPVPDKVFCSPTRLIRVVTGCRNNMPVRIVTSGGDPVRIVASGGEPVRVVTHGGDPVRIVEGEI